MPKSKPSFFIWFIKYVIPPVLVILLAFSVVWIAIVSQEQPEKKAPSAILPTVEVYQVRSESLNLEAKSQGIVQSRTETMLIAEVSGRIQSISNAFSAGGYFKKGDSLIEIDPLDYEANLAAAKSRYAEAMLAYEQEKALSAQAIEDWTELDKGEGSELALRKPQLNRAKALLESTKAGVLIAERDLERATVRAPYDGRIRQKLADVGQMVSARQTQLGSIYSTDTAEIRLPVSLKDIKYLDLPESYSNQAIKRPKPKVTIYANYGERVYTWEGIIDRTEGAIDPTTRLSYVVAQIESPYRKQTDNDRPPLKVGLFVEASIEGKRLPNAIRIPRQALRANDTVYVVNKENRLDFKTVNVYKTDTESAIITDGLNDGDRVCLTPLEYAVIGMQVQIDSQARLSIKTAPAN